MELEIRENVALAPLTTIRVGGLARWFVEARRWEDLHESAVWARRRNAPMFVLAGGSNVIFPDDGFPGVVVFIGALAGFAVDGSVITADAGAAVAELVDDSIARGLRGLEWAGGLPGTLGGAVRGNAGAFGGEIKDSVAWVEAMDVASGRSARFSGRECEFSYRESRFKRVPLVITRVQLMLEEGGNSAELRAIADDHIRYRAERHPQEPNAGSMFKNVIVRDRAALPAALRDVETVLRYGKLPAGAVIERCGLKGIRIGGAQISLKHANHIVNLGSARARDIIALLEMLERAARERFGLHLEREVHIVVPRMHHVSSLIHIVGEN